MSLSVALHCFLSFSNHCTLCEVNLFFDSGWGNETTISYHYPIVKAVVVEAEGFL